MHLILLKLLSRVDTKRVTIITLSVGAAILYAYIHEQNVQLETTRLVYSNPTRGTKTAKRKETGTVRIITRVIERPSGHKETTIEETREPVIEMEAEVIETSPVPIDVAMKPVRSDRYLLTVGFNRLSADTDGKALFVGYGINNRLDFHVGGIRRDGFSPWLLATIRF